MSIISYCTPSSSSSFSSSSSSLQPNHQLSPCPNHLQTSSLKLSRSNQSKLFRINGGGRRRRITPVYSAQVSPWDDKPHQILPGGEISYYDEQDVVSFLDPPKQLIPLDPSSYNPAAYLWKKIDDIPEERRHRLLPLFNPRLISRAWEVAGTRYDNPKLAKQSSSTIFTNNKVAAKLLEFWNCRTNGGPLAVAWINFFKMALFSCEDGQTFGRVIDASIFGGLSRSFSPLYFTVKAANEVMATEHPCDISYEFGNGLLDIKEFPQGFPKPGKHPWPFNDDVVIYIRHVGPGVAVGQAWQQGQELDQIPKKLSTEILMVKDYANIDQTW